MKTQKKLPVYTQRDLQQNTEWTNSILKAQKEQAQQYTDPYILFQTNNQKDYDNFMKLTLQPQKNPFGLTGNPLAMKDLELQGSRRPTTVRNPMMNVDISEYNEKQKYSKAHESSNNKKVQENLHAKLFQSPSDYFWNRQASERQFYTMPNSSVPNEQMKFAQWLYGNNYVGKTGSIYDRYGYPYTPDSLVNTGYNASVPENAGQVENNYGTPIVYNSSPWVNNPNYGYGFGGLPGAVPFHNIVPGQPNMAMYPMPIYPPSFPGPEYEEPVPTVPAGIF
jgi:hypothetical protein